MGSTLSPKPGTLKPFMVYVIICYAMIYVIL